MPRMTLDWRAYDIIVLTPVRTLEGRRGADREQTA